MSTFSRRVKKMNQLIYGRNNVGKILHLLRRLGTEMFAMRGCVPLPPDWGTDALPTVDCTSRQVTTSSSTNGPLAGYPKVSFKDWEAGTG